MTSGAPSACALCAPGLFPVATACEVSFSLSGSAVADPAPAAPPRRTHLVLAPADVAWKSAPSALSSATRVGSRNPTRQSRCGRALPLRVSRESDVAANETRAAGGRGCPMGARRRRQDPGAGCQALSSPLVRSVPGVHCRARRLGGRRVAERAAVLRSRKARPAIPRGDFPPCDPRRVEYHRRISAPSTCRPHASVVAAGAEEYELGAVSRRVERRRLPRLLVLQEPVVDIDLTKQC
jgi:hypothetical protein